MADAQAILETLLSQNAQTADALNNILERLSTLEKHHNAPPTTVPIPKTPTVNPNSAHTTSDDTGSRRNHLRPSAPSNFDGERSQGRAFINTCLLYFSLCPEQFPDNARKIHWVLTFFKSGRASTWAARVMREELSSSQAKWNTWDQFYQDFEEAFCPLHEQTAALTKLESDKYFQGRRSVEDYVDEFQDLILDAGYKDGLAVVMKFRRGLDPRIQDRIAEMGSERPKDDDPAAWYRVARRLDQNQAANRAFHSSLSRLAPPNPTSRANPTAPPRPFTFAVQKPPPPIPAAPAFRGVPMEVDTTRRRGSAPITCYRCGKVGHIVRDCPMAVDIRYMDADERQTWMEYLNTNADVADAEACSAQIFGNAETAEATAEKEAEGFQNCSR